MVACKGIHLVAYPANSKERQHGLVIEGNRLSLFLDVPAQDALGESVQIGLLAVAINGLVSSRTINPNEGRAWLGMNERAGGEEFANPNTGSSQPGSQTSPISQNATVAPPKIKDDPDADE